MLQNKQLNEVGIIQYVGNLGPEPTTPTYMFQGQRRGFPPGTTPESCVMQMCAEFGQDYDRVTDKYYGLSYKSKISAITFEKLAVESDYSLLDCVSILANVLVIIGQQNGLVPAGTISNELALDRLAEALRILPILEQKKQEAYAEYPKESEQ